MRFAWLSRASAAGGWAQDQRHDMLGDCAGIHAAGAASARHAASAPAREN
jgi:hypothetical protein